MKIDQVGSLAAHNAAVATGAMPQILLWVSAFEAISTVAVIQMLEGSGRAPGDFGFDPLNLKKKGSEAKKVSIIHEQLYRKKSFCFILSAEAHLWWNVVGMTSRTVLTFVFHPTDVTCAKGRLACFVLPINKHQACRSFGDIR